MGLESLLMGIIPPLRSETVLRDPKFSFPRLARLAMLCAALFSMAACSRTKAAAPTTPVVPVLAATVEQKDMPVQLEAIGSVEAYSSVTVKTQVTGELTGVYFREGQDVNKGDL